MKLKYIQIGHYHTVSVTAAQAEMPFIVLSLKTGSSILRGARERAAMRRRTLAIAMRDAAIVAQQPFLPRAL